MFSSQDQETALARRLNMTRITKRIVTDDGNRPVAVQIDYQDWLAFRRRIRDEWA